MSALGKCFLKVGCLTQWTCIRCITTTRVSFSLETHYEVLNVERNANSKQIREAYIKKCKEYHPDKNIGRGDAEFKRITEAYEVLCDNQRKQDYDNSFSSDSAWSSPDEKYDSNPNLHYQELRNARERSRAYGYPETDDEYFRKYSPMTIAMACVAFAVGSFFVHFYIAYLGYEKHTRHLDKVKDRLIQQNKAPSWMNYAASSHPVEEQEYTEEAIEQRKQLDILEQYERPDYKEGREIDPFRKYRSIKSNS
ncbi:unnamed protein product [Lepeophtheirus salmonis]|uniref:(salmon louse) hypothetical protein n=1 Tax=Lepeophtheirus salmonis TaxID=72036 RepID=A0A7R8CFZ8_LEPSM|nr:dnaJ homolog subfamily C member 28-like [Lepeophtheirus salmonis]CAB4055203.1 unnamed protein product [Lepeophtheirus salmonis]CAF2770776.1 unnamed protein product [Lepeophtheirus salmonis]